jgi:hypothetical protein
LRDVGASSRHGKEDFADGNQQTTEGPAGAQRGSDRNTGALGKQRKRGAVAVPHPVRLAARITRQNVLGILRVVRNTYYPRYRLSDVIENIYVSLPVFIAHVAGKPATASQVARMLEMPRNTAVRKLNWLIKQGYVTRHGRKYCMTDKINVTGLEQVLRMHARLCKASAKNLSILDTRS